MSEIILAVLSPDQRTVAEPHVTRFQAAEREMEAAERAMLLTVHALFPALMQSGVRFDTNRLALVRDAPEEASDGAA